MAIRVANVTAQILFTPTTHNRSVSHTIVFTEEPFRRKLRMGNFTAQALLPGAPAIHAIVSQSISFTEFTIFLNLAGDREIPENTINWVQVANATSFPSVSQTINFSQVANNNLNFGISNQFLGLQQGVNVCFGAPWSAIVVNDTLALVQNLSTVFNETVTDTLSLVQSTHAKNGQVEQFLELIQTATGGVGKIIEQTLSISQAIVTESDFIRSVSDSNVVTQAFTYFIDNPCSQKSYAKFDGEGPGSGLETKHFNYDNSFTLETTGGGPKTQLVLRSPETDDRDRLGFNRVNRETRGGELNVFSDPAWAKVNTLLFTIVSLTDGKNGCPDKISALLTFLQDTLGKEIILHDWTGVSWQGVITTPNEVATEDRDGHWTVTFEFEGVTLPGIPLSQPLGVSDTLTRLVDWVRPVTQSINFSESLVQGGSLNQTVTQSISFSETMGGTHEITILDDDLSAGAGTNLDGTSPGTGSGTWRAHTNFKDNGTQSGSTPAGAFFAFTPVSGTVYECTWDALNEVTSSDSDNIIAGFFEGKSISNSITGATADGTIDPTTLKAGHCRRDVSGSAEHAYRLGTESDGLVDTIEWTNTALRESASTTLDMRITIDTTAGAGNWTAEWFAKETASGTYTQVGPVTQLLNENIGAVGWSNDNGNTNVTLGQITLLELRPI
jgi:hypothetical protein